MNALSNEDLIEMWRTYPLGDDELKNLTNTRKLESVAKRREAIYEQLKSRNLLPNAVQDSVNDYESSTGVYPDTEDPMFLQKLLRKQEFAESKQLSVAESIRQGIDPCKGSKGFELSPTQRFIGQYLSPKTPYMSALLFHGVGVGKTCSAITVAENFLEMFPRKQVIIVAPRNIQPNFSREVFSESKLKIGEDDEPNEYLGCTGQTYLRLTGTEYVRDKSVIMNRVNHLKARRYQLVGYLAFYNYLKTMLEREIGKSLKGERRAQEERKLLNRRFSNRLIIIDEAHNVRDLTEGDDDSADAPGGKAELSESQAGKKLTPYLRKLLAATDGTKLLLLTATPMYNSYKEIIPILNLLLINDKKTTVSESDFFDKDGNFLEDGEEKFGNIVKAYVSFMRGENPLAFPIRLPPESEARLEVWPTRNPLGDEITNEGVRKQIVKLPFLAAEHTPEGLRNYRSIVSKLIVGAGLRLAASDGMVQAGNFIFPASGETAIETRIREQGFKTCFSETKEPRQFRLNPGIPPNWLHEGELQKYSPKCNMLLERVRGTKGVSFIYSRFVFSGALSIALALEANGYENAMRSPGYLKDVPLAPGGKQCAFCAKKQGDHTGQNHAFRQAKYVLLTGRDDLTPNNKGAIEMATQASNVEGADVKVVIGSQVASEGIDLKFIRELLVFDSWYHLNKLEQVIGRGIRFCSHALLPKVKRNCTVVLLLTSFPASQSQETIDMYQYRMGFEKAYQIGQITRVMKQYAIDCNLNHDAILLQGLDPIDLEDSQGELRLDHPIDDVPFTSVCDWIEDCDYDCAVPVEINMMNTDESTYDEYAARWRAHTIKERLRKLFELQPFYSFDKLLYNLTDIPRVAISSILSDIVGNRSFRITVKGETGYVLYKNGYFLFQPDKLYDTGIPLALRAALFPVKQDSYEDYEPARERRPVAVAPGPEAAKGTTVAAVANLKEVVEEKPSAPVAEVRGDPAAFWDVIERFIDSIQEGELTNARSDKKILPDSLENAIKNRYTGNKKAADKVYNTLSMIHRFYQDVKANDEWREYLAYAAAKLIWDEVLNYEEQYRLYEAKKEAPSPLLSNVWDEHLISFDEQIVYRRVNPSTGSLEYKCDGKDCSPALIAAIEAEDEASDPLRNLRANTTTSGKPYGTLNYKNGLFVFKTNNPVRPSTKPGVREKQERGAECANVPNMLPHYNLLEEIGRIATDALGTNLGFTLTELEEAQPPRGVVNSVRACALTDIALRFFDELHVQDKRWFYRPLPTFYTKHPGILRQKSA